jgi:hypothetical protein
MGGRVERILIFFLFFVDIYIVYFKIGMNSGQDRWSFLSHKNEIVTYLGKKD